MQGLGVSDRRGEGRNVERAGEVSCGRTGDVFIRASPRPPM